MEYFDKDFLARVKKILNDYPKIEELNTFIKEQTGLHNFVESNERLNDLKLFLKHFSKNIKKIKDYGEFQTPIYLSNKICEYLSKIKNKPVVLLEPTCGEGNFIISAINHFPTLRYIYCVDLQGKNEWIFKLKIIKLQQGRKSDLKIEFFRDDIFTHKFNSEFVTLIKKNNGNLLILGNPPWITNTELSTLNSNNLPEKSNIKNVKGIEAITGKGNFDISEAIILNLIERFKHLKIKMALLCKTSVIKNIIKAVPILGLEVSNNQAFLINAKQEFDINANAALYITDIGSGQDNTCIVNSFYDNKKRMKRFGYYKNVFVSNFDLYEKYQYLEGKSTYNWRQGVKHDASKVMILKKITKNKYLNGLDEEIEVEDDFLYPFLKGSRLKAPIISNNLLNHRIIITQETLNQDTNIISSKNPKLWDYLNSHSEYLDNRKSIIYKDRPRFSLFGIGNYAFKPFKIGISGFNKIPVFSLISPFDNRPVMLDDTSYYLSFDDYNEAIFTWILLNSQQVKNFLLSISFLESKRPFNKGILMRIKIQKLLKETSFETLGEIFIETLKDHDKIKLEKNDFLNFKNKEFLN